MKHKRMYEHLDEQTHV